MKSLLQLIPGRPLILAAILAISALVVLPRVVHSAMPVPSACNPYDMYAHKHCPVNTPNLWMTNLRPFSNMPFFPYSHQYAMPYRPGIQQMQYYQPSMVYRPYYQSSYPAYPPMFGGGGFGIGGGGFAGASVF